MKQISAVAIIGVAFFCSAQAARITTTRSNLLADNKNELPLMQLVRNCLLSANSSSTFDIMIDIARNPQTNEQNRRAQYSNAVSRFLGKYFGPIFIDYIRKFVAAVQVDMDSEKLYSVVVDGTTRYYLNESSTSFDETLTTTTTKKPNEFVGFFRGIGASIQRFFHSADGSAVSGMEAEDFDPKGTALSRVTARTLKARAADRPIRLPTSKPSQLVTVFTIVLTDGAQGTSPSFYPDNSIILDIGGGWSASSASRSYTQRNVIFIEDPEDLKDFVDIVRLMMCQSIGGIRGQAMLF